jgi:hypothetical protein
MQMVCLSSSALSVAGTLPRRMLVDKVDDAFTHPLSFSHALSL